MEAEFVHFWWTGVFGLRDASSAGNTPAPAAFRAFTAEAGRHVSNKLNE